MANPRIDELRKRLEKEPGSRLFAQLAEELRKDGDLEEAIQVCREGLRRQPNYPSARMTLGRALFDSGDLPSARAELESVLKGAPDNILAGRLLGECLERQGERVGALARFKATLSLAPGDRQILDRIRALEAGKPAAAEAATIMMPAPAPQPAAPAWPPAPAAASVIETTLVDVPAPFASDEPTEVEHAAVTVVEVEQEGFELERPYQIEPTVVETSEELHGFAAPPAEAPAALDEPARYETPPTIVGSVRFSAVDEPTTLAAAPAEAESLVDLETSPPAPPPARETPPTPSAPVQPERDLGAEAELNTATLAELYLSQGVMDKAIAVYRQLLERDPLNERARTRLAEVEALDRRIRAEEALAAGQGAGNPRAARRQAIERTIAKLQELLLALRKG